MKNNPEALAGEGRPGGAARIAHRVSQPRAPVRRPIAPSDLSCPIRTEISRDGHDETGC